MGMTPEQYWNGDSSLTKAFREAYKIRREERNWELWMQGLYIYNAISTALANVMAKSGTTPKEYIKEPLRIFPMTEEEIAEAEEKERQRLVDNLNRFKRAWELKNE